MIGEQVARWVIGFVGGFSSLLNPAYDETDELHQTLSTFLAQVVRGEAVDYEEARSQEPLLRRYLTELAEFPEARLSGSSEAFQLAFWINAYNAVMVATVLDHWPLEDRWTVIGWFFPDRSVWQIEDVWKREDYRIAENPRSLDEIEHEILRVQFAEPRIHFAINCASVGCPPLRNEAYLADRLELQLTEQTRAFLGDQVRGARIGTLRGGRELRISRIFKWFGEDFEGVPFSKDAPVAATLKGRKRNLLAYILQERPEWNAGSPWVAVKFLKYDWSLNDSDRR